MSIVAQKKPSLAETHPELAKQWSSRNEVGSDEVMPFSNRKAWWVGECRHEWEAVIASRSAGRGCPYCAGQKVLQGFNDLATTHLELSSQWDNQNTLRANEVISGSGKKVWWIGSCGHRWEDTVIHRTERKYGCPYCSGNRVLFGFNDLTTTNPELAAQWSNKNTDSPETVSMGSAKKVWWIGKCGHEWEAIINSRAQGRGCPVCSGKQVLIGSNDLKTTHPNLSAEWSIKNLLIPQEITAGCGKKVWWTGECGHEWEARVDSRVRGNGCPYCAGQKVLHGFNDLTTTHPEISKEWGVNNKFGPIEVTAGSEKQVWWVGKCGHEWKTAVKNRTLNGTNCPHCLKGVVLVGFNDLATTKPELVPEWSDRNYTKPTDITKGSGKKVWWICNKGHEWEARVSDRSKFNGTNCPYCSGHAVLVGFNDLGTLHPWLIPYYSKDNPPIGSYTSGSDSKIDLICAKGHTWNTRIYSVTRGVPECPECRGIGVSYIEKQLISTLKEIYSITPQYEIKYNSNKRIIVDGMFKHYDRKFVLEYDGSYWHSTTLSKDIFKTNILLKEGYSVIRVRENDLPFLPLESDNLLQIRFNYTADHKHLPYLVDQIINYVTSPGIHSRS